MKNTDRARFSKKKCFGQILAKKWPKIGFFDVFGTFKKNFAKVLSGNGLRQRTNHVRPFRKNRMSNLNFLAEIWLKIWPKNGVKYAKIKVFDTSIKIQSLILTGSDFK